MFFQCECCEAVGSGVREAFDADAAPDACWWGCAYEHRGAFFERVERRITWLLVGRSHPAASCATFASAIQVVSETGWKGVHMGRRVQTKHTHRPGVCTCVEPLVRMDHYSVWKCARILFCADQHVACFPLALQSAVVRQEQECRPLARPALQARTDLPARTCLFTCSELCIHECEALVAIFEAHGSRCCGSFDWVLCDDMVLDRMIHICRCMGARFSIVDPRSAPPLPAPAVPSQRIAAAMVRHGPGTTSAYRHAYQSIEIGGNGLFSATLDLRMDRVLVDGAAACADLAWVITAEDGAPAEWIQPRFAPGLSCVRDASALAMEGACTRVVGRSVDHVFRHCSAHPSEKILFCDTGAYDSVILRGIRNHLPLWIVCHPSVSSIPNYAPRVSTRHHIAFQRLPAQPFLHLVVDTPVCAPRYRGTARQREFLHCIRQNCAVDLVAAVWCLCEHALDEEVASISPKIRPIHTGTRLSYREAFRWIEENVQDGVVCLTNADITFDHPSVCRLREIAAGECWALSRWNRDDKDPDLICLQEDPKRSQDAWVCRAPVPRGTHLHMPESLLVGTPGCDNCIARILERPGFRVTNPSRSVALVHEHANFRSAVYNASNVCTIVRHKMVESVHL
jgi:hypothetical protein